ncbi:hypothetical protein [Paludibaculum fermentans]|uniref:Uncharacterized protein n=1 Tax=Paludibaculum fermentans TaxID=1473598 RepID=A0A7S7NR12_PALFE|nr:hypothetical protein [Paludibaculum fermentans]QOY88168.1 hypothetical protein IRI77_36440 [Paludibaculum fermentans]
MQQRFIGIMMLVVAVTGKTPAWAGDKGLEKALRQTSPLPRPIEVRRPVDVTLDQFRQLVLAYGIPMGYGPIVIEIDYLGNISMNDKYPNDIGQYARDVLAKIGVFRTFRTLPQAAASTGSSGFVLPQLLRERGTPPKPNFRLVGSIVGAEQVVVKGRNGRLDGQGGGGQTATNGGASFDRGSTVTAITIALTLETWDSLDVEGASARYRIFVEQTESNRGVDLYVGGNGFGLGSRLRITQDSSDAIYDSMAVNLIQILGAALKLPVHRIDSQFRRDAALEQRVRQEFGGLTDLELEDELRRFMLVDGFKIGRQPGPLPPADKAMLMLEMQHRGLRVERAGMMEMTMQFWRGLNYQEAANRVAEIRVENNLKARQNREQEAIQQAALRVDPREFGFTPGSRIIVVDLSRIGRPDLLQRISATLQRCSICGEVRWHPQKPLIGLNTAMKESDVQYLMNSTRLPLEFVWSHVDSPRLLVVPASGTPQQGVSAAAK